MPSRQGERERARGEGADGTEGSGAAADGATGGSPAAPDEAPPPTQAAPCGEADAPRAGHAFMGGTESAETNGSSGAGSGGQRGRREEA